MATLRLHALAHSRTGDKGDSQTLSVIAYDPADYPLLRGVVTEAAVARHFAGVVRGAGAVRVRPMALCRPPLVKRYQ